MQFLINKHYQTITKPTHNLKALQVRLIMQMFIDKQYQTVIGRTNNIKACKIWLFMDIFRFVFIKGTTYE